MDGKGQEIDTLGGMRKFLQVCNQYQHIPLQMDLSMQNSTNLITSEGDTMQFHARFYLQKEGSYIQFGELEQIVNDSLMLLVNKKLKRMIVSPNHQSTQNQLDRFLGVQFKDSSLWQLTARFSTISLPLKEGKQIIELKGRLVLTYTDLPKEEMRVTYDPGTEQPSEVMQVKRSLIPLSDVDYNHLSMLPSNKDKLVKVSDSSFYVIKELVSTFTYNEITHREGVSLPVKTGDRIWAGASGMYQPVKGLDDYRVTQK